LSAPASLALGGCDEQAQGIPTKARQDLHDAACNARLGLSEQGGPSRPTVAPVRDAVEAISKGNASKEHWSAIFDALNMIEQFDQMPQVMTGARDYIESMQTVIVGILDRAKSGKRALYPSELNDLHGFVDLWSDVLTTVTHRDYFVCEEKTHKRLVQVLREGKGVKVLEVA
jgi:hypothetical protein